MKRNGYCAFLQIIPDTILEETEMVYRQERKAYELEGRVFCNSRSKESEEAYEVLVDEERRRSYDENQSRVVTTMEKLEQKAQEGRVKMRLESTMDAFTENPLEIPVLTVLVVLLVLATKS